MPIPICRICTIDTGIRHARDMNVYDKWILPRLTDLAMRNKEATRYRSQIVPQACGTVLEIGVGSGLNLPFYGATVSRLFALDPSEACRKAAWILALLAIDLYIEQRKYYLP